VYDAIVIGAGPAGSRSAELLSNKGFSVLVLEEHPAVGHPVQCAGLVTPRVFDIVPHKKTMVEEIKGANIHTPGGRTLSIGGQRTEAVVIDRAGFDRALAADAVKAGAELRLRTKATGAEFREDRAVVTYSGPEGKGTAEARLLVGADGPNSPTARWAGLPRPKEFLSGLEVEAAGAEDQAGFVELFVGTDVAPGFFAWSIPSGETARIGLAVKSGVAREYLDKLLAMQFPGVKPLHYMAGPIPLGPVEKCYGDRVMLVGDAAGQVKGTSGGGIYMGLKCAGHLADAAEAALESGDVSKSALSKYQKAWSQDVGHELKTAMRLHRAFDALDDRKMDEIADILQKKDLLELINMVGDIDYPSRVAWELVKKAPELLKYTGAMIRGMLK